MDSGGKAKSAGKNGGKNGTRGVHHGPGRQSDGQLCAKKCQQMDKREALNSMAVEVLRELMLMIPQRIVCSAAVSDHQIQA